MTITAKTKDLLRIVNLVSAVTPTRTTLPSFNAVLLAYYDCVLTAFASDARSFAKSHCEASGEQSVSFGLRADLLAAFLSRCTDETVDIEVGPRATLTSGKMKAVLSIVQATEFPEHPVTHGGVYKISATELRNALSHVIHAASDDTTNKATLCSVVFGFKDGLSIAAYSGYQIAVIHLNIDGSGTYIIPRSLISVLIQTLDKMEGEIAFGFDEKTVQFYCADWALSGVLINGQFPNWRAMNEWGGMGVSTLPRHPLIDAIKGCMPFGEAGFVRIYIHGDGENATVEIGGQNATSSVMEMKGEPFDFFVEGKKMLAMLSAMNGETVALEHAEQKGVGIVVREDNFTAAIMPLEK